MKTVIRVDFRSTWDYPVNLIHSRSQKTVVSDPRQAIKYLQHDFTVKTGKSYRKAYASCMAAIHSKGDLEVARNDFIVAYTEYMFKLYH